MRQAFPGESAFPDEPDGEDGDDHEDAPNRQGRECERGGLDLQRILGIPMVLVRREGCSDMHFRFVGPCEIADFQGLLPYEVIAGNLQIMVAEMDFPEIISLIIHIHHPSE